MAYDIPYYGSPIALLWSDLKLIILLAPYIPVVLSPLTTWGSGPLDELYPSFENIRDLTSHVLLLVLQILFLLAFCAGTILAPGAIVIPATLAFLLANYAFCTFALNGRGGAVRSTVDLSSFPDRSSERWIFVNGVAVGQHWLQSNVNRLAQTFGREVLSIHNPTNGVIFDLLQCFLERDFLYDTFDTRAGFPLLKAALEDPGASKVVLILHSQGGIEGGLMADLLLAALPSRTLQRLEVYTFASAANHFCNPARAPGAHARALRHVEHYANAGDFVSRWGVLHFAKGRGGGRFAGRLFERAGTGHLLNQHYLGPMFPLDPRTGRVADTNAWVETPVEPGRTVAQASRLWAYRNGMEPPSVQGKDE